MIKRRGLPPDELDRLTPFQRFHHHALQQALEKEVRILDGEEPARPLQVMPPAEFKGLFTEHSMFNPALAGTLVLLAAVPFPGNPLQKLALSSQRSLQRRRAAQMGAHKRARARGLPSPNLVHDAIERAIAANGSRRGAITYAAQYFRINERQVHRLEKTWQESSTKITKLTAEIAEYLSLTLTQ